MSPSCPIPATDPRLHVRIGSDEGEVGTTGRHGVVATSGLGGDRLGLTHAYDEPGRHETLSLQL